MAFSYGILAHGVWRTALISFPAIAASWRGGLSTEKGDAMLRDWAKKLLDHVDAKVELEGAENLDPEKGPFVVLSNHISIYDIPALFVSLPLSLRMAAKTELFKTPVWGRAMRASGFVEINRGSPKEAHKALRSAGEKMRADGISLNLAPEGTRSDDGTLGEFKRGGFQVAQVTGLPILPVAIWGTQDIHRKNASSVTRGQTARVRVLPAVDPKDFKKTNELRQYVRDQIAAALEEMKGAPQPTADPTAD